MYYSGLVGKDNRETPVRLNAKGEELLPHTSFGIAGSEDSNWADSDGNAIVPISVLDNVYPYNVNSAIEVDNSNDLAFTWSNNLGAALYDRELSLEIVARYFPDIADPNNYDASTHNYITSDSFDFNEIFVEVICSDNNSDIPEGNTSGSDDNNKSVITRYVSTHWGFIRIPVVVSFYNQSVKFRIYSNNKKIQIAKISLTNKIY